MHRISSLIIILLLLLARPAFALRHSDLPGYDEAFEALSREQTLKARILVARGTDSVLNDVLLGRLMALPDNDYGFDEIAVFLANHPFWPGLNAIRAAGEQKIPDGAPNSQIVNWFNAYPPLTEAGFARFIAALNATGEEKRAIGLIRAHWIETDFSKSDLLAFHSRYAPLLRAQDHNKRLDRLLWDEKSTAARLMYQFVDKAHKALSEARLALMENKSKITPLLNAIPAALTNDPGLAYERLRWRKNRDIYTGAFEILENPPKELGRPVAWWKIQHVMARHLMEKKNFKRAYQIVKRHGLSADDGFEYLQAEFLAGWLALRFLHQPATAEKHFRNMTETATSPVSKARAHYWLARAQEDLGQKEKAVTSYETAAVFNTTFYGQLSIAKLYKSPTIQAANEPEIPSGVKLFFDRPIIRATEKLVRIDKEDLATRFFMTSLASATQRVEFTLLMEQAHMLSRPDWAIKAAKEAAQKGFLLTGAAYPILSVEIPVPPDIAFTHALIRQESMFQPDAGSSAGARGLMQLMPTTAKGVATKLGLSFHATRLADPSYNLKLGTYFIQKQIDDFDGSFVLALAGYNAGPRRARDWIANYGDPRAGTIDPVDWIELIPVYETRNYIQRILENLQFYRARLNGGEAPLMIVEDLKR